MTDTKNLEPGEVYAVTTAAGRTLTLRVVRLPRTSHVSSSNWGNVYYTVIAIRVRPDDHSVSFGRPHFYTFRADNVKEA
jgi:hypothetical protein